MKEIIDLLASYQNRMQAKSGGANPCYYLEVLANGEIWLICDLDDNFQPNSTSICQFLTVEHLMEFLKGDENLC